MTTKKKASMHIVSVAAVSAVVLLMLNSITKAEPYTGIQLENYRSLYSDQKAQHVGDIVTIIIAESSKASKSTTTKNSKKTGSDGRLSELLGLAVGDLPLNLGVNGGSDYSGSGTITRSGNMEARLSSVVKEVLPNGNLVLEGTRQVTINNDVQTITISGIVDPKAITQDNTVLSTYVANAQIKYAGEGPTSSDPGFITRYAIKILQMPFNLVSGIFRRIF